MNWLNIETATLDSEEFVGSDPIARATWLCLFRYCAGQENGGSIKGCKDWADRKWQQLARVTKDEVQTPSALWSWEGNSLRLWAYPAEKETEVQAKRNAGRMGGKSKSEAKLKAARENGFIAHEAEHEAEHEASHERNGREWKGKEGEEKENRKDVGENETAADAATTSAELVLGDDTKVAKPEKQTDAQWIAGIKADPAFAGIDVEREHAKCIRWCSENGKQQTRRRFINWLNRCDRPIGAAVSAAQQRSEELSKVNGYEY